MQFLFVDESGCPGTLPSNTSNIQPIFCLLGLLVPESSLQKITLDFIALKRKFCPHMTRTLNHDLEIILREVKGSDLRKDVRKGSRNKQRRARKMLEEVFLILEENDIKFIARAYIKTPGETFNGKGVYSSSIQNFCGDFNRYLEDTNDVGIVIADNRNYPLNSNVSFSVFTRKFMQQGDKFPRIAEMPVFGHSENHACLQITDWLSSGILFPILSNVYCKGKINSVHVHPNDILLKNLFSQRLKKIQYFYEDKGIIKKFSIKKIGLDWDIVSGKLIKSGWAKEVHPSMLKLTAEGEAQSTEMLNTWGTNFGDILQQTQKTTTFGGVTVIDPAGKRSASDIFR